MIVNHLAARGEQWEYKVKGFAVCEKLIEMNPNHTKFSYK